MIGKILDIITKVGDKSQGAPKQKVQVVDMAELEEELAEMLMEQQSQQRPSEPDLRTIGLFSDVSEERVAELIHAMLYLDEVNKLNKKDKKPIKFYISTYGGSADDMFGMYDVMRNVRENNRATHGWSRKGYVSRRYSIGRWY